MARLIDNHSHQRRKPARLLLTALAPNQPAYVDRVDWAAMSDSDGKRLRELGLCEGASIELLHRAGLLGWLLSRLGIRRRGAHACRVGRMIVAMRATHAAAIEVRTGADEEAGAA